MKWPQFLLMVSSSLPISNFIPRPTSSNIAFVTISASLLSHLSMDPGVTHSFLIPNAGKSMMSVPQAPVRSFCVKSRVRNSSRNSSSSSLRRRTCQWVVSGSPFTLADPKRVSSATLQFHTSLVLMCSLSMTWFPPSGLIWTKVAKSLSRTNLNSPTLSLSVQITPIHSRAPFSRTNPSRNRWTQTLEVYTNGLWGFPMTHNLNQQSKVKILVKLAMKSINTLGSLKSIPPYCKAARMTCPLRVFWSPTFQVQDLLLIPPPSPNPLSTNTNLLCHGTTALFTFQINSPFHRNHDPFSHPPLSTNPWCIPTFHINNQSHPLIIPDPKTNISNHILPTQLLLYPEISPTNPFQSSL